MLLTYLKDGARIKTTEPDENVVFSSRHTETRFTVTLTAKTDIVLCDALLQSRINAASDDLMFLNGYQSWTDTREVFPREKEKDLYRAPHSVIRKFSMDRYGDAAFYPYKKYRLHGYDVFYIKGKCECFLFNVNRETAYLVIECDKRNKTIALRSDIGGLSLRAGETCTLYDYCQYGTIEAGLAAFREAYPPREAPKLFGYTSWYNHYQNISEEILLKDLAALDSRFDLFQIDDGFETFVGDWLDVDEKKFPHGLAPVAEKIRAQGYKAGIWLAPFAAEEKSRLFREHKDWIRRGADGAPVRCGGNWSGFYALDLSNPEAVSYIRRVLAHYADLGFDFFKLDFLYAAGVTPPEGKTRAQAQNEAYALLREALPGKIILGCGATILSSYGNFDYLRVGPDVSLSFDDVWYMRYFHRERVSTKTTLQNTIYRSFLNGHFFGNDPDVFLLRDTNNRLKAKQKKALLTINALFGSVLMTSDNLAEYGETQKALLEKALALFRAEKTVRFARRDERIEIAYCAAGGEETVLVYDTEKGVLSDG